MKNKLLLVILVFSVAKSKSQNVGIGTPTPKTSLDIKGGFRNQPLYLTGSGTVITIPDNESNINLTGNFSAQFFATVKNPEDGQRLIIDNNSNETGALIGGPDIRGGLNEYIFSDGEWKTIKTNGWDLNGNFNTNPATQFIGTTDKNDVVFKRFNTERFRIAEEGLQIKASNTLEFGAGILNKQTDNGKIGYNAFGEVNTLSIVGGGVSATGADRRIKLWADLGTDFTGGALFNKSVEIKNNAFNMLSFTNTNALAAGTTHLLSFGGTNYTTGLISVIGTSSSAARMAFSTGYSFTGGVSNMQERLSISNTGNIGIGKPNPNSKLDVAGDINTTGLIKLNDVSGTAGQVLTSNGATAPSWTNTAFSNDIRFGVNIREVSPTNTRIRLDEVYNTAPGLITVIPANSTSDGEIMFTKAGLYRINGTIGHTIQFLFTAPTQAPSVFIDLHANNFIYNIAKSLAMPRIIPQPLNINSDFRYSIINQFSFDVYLPANTAIKITSGTLSLPPTSDFTDKFGSFSGYLISE